jgi:hypothetical protein
MCVVQRVELRSVCVVCARVRVCVNGVSVCVGAKCERSCVRALVCVCVCGGGGRTVMAVVEARRPSFNRVVPGTAFVVPPPRLTVCYGVHYASPFFCLRYFPFLCLSVTHSALRCHHVRCCCHVACWPAGVLLTRAC